MNKKTSNAMLGIALATVCLFVGYPVGQAAPQEISATAQQTQKDVQMKQPLIIAEQGSFAIGGATKQHEGDFSLEQFQRTWTPYTGALDDEVSAEALAALFERTGSGILVTHSMGGAVGWRTLFRTDKVKAVVAFEPGGRPFPFPKGEKPAPIVASYAPVSATAEEVPLQDFERLTKVPIILFYGDNIAKEPTKDIGPDKWRTEMAMAQKFVEAINHHGGQAEIVHLPDIGIYGNTHFLMGDTNNEQIAELMAQWLEKHGLAGYLQAK